MTLVDIWFWGAIILAVVVGAGAAILDRRKLVDIREDIPLWMAAGCALWPTLIIAGVFWLAWAFGDWAADYKPKRKASR